MKVLPHSHKKHLIRLSMVICTPSTMIVIHYSWSTSSHCLVHWCCSHPDRYHSRIVRVPGIRRHRWHGYFFRFRHSAGGVTIAIGVQCIPSTIVWFLTAATTCTTTTPIRAISCATGACASKLFPELHCQQRWQTYILTLNSKIYSHKPLHILLHML